MDEDDVKSDKTVKSNKSENMGEKSEDKKSEKSEGKKSERQVYLEKKDDEKFLDICVDLIDRD